MQNCLGGRDPGIFKRKFPLSAGGLGTEGGGRRGKEWATEEGRGDEASGRQGEREICCFLRIQVRGDGLFRMVCCGRKTYFKVTREGETKRRRGTRWRLLD